MRKSRWIVATVGAVAALGLGSIGAFAYAGQPGPPATAPQSGTLSAAQVQERQQQMIELHQQYGVPLGQPLRLMDGTGPHGAGAGTMNPADCPYRTTT